MVTQKVTKCYSMAQNYISHIAALYNHSQEQLDLLISNNNLSIKYHEAIPICQVPSLRSTNHTFVTPQIHLAPWQSIHEVKKSQIFSRFYSSSLLFFSIKKLTEPATTPISNLLLQWRVASTFTGVWLWRWTIHNILDRKLVSRGSSLLRARGFECR